MSTTIGLAVASDELRALIVRGGVVTWAIRAGRTPEPALSRQIADLLAAAPISSWERPRIIAAIGPSAAQLKHLTGLPPITDRVAIDALVQEGVGRFFLRNGVPLVTSGARIVAPGCVWAAAFERPVITELALGCRLVRRTLRAVVPGADAVLSSVENSRISWRDGEFGVAMVRVDGALNSVRRAYASDTDDAESHLHLVAPLATLGEEAWRFADAYGAAISRDSEPLAFRTHAEDRSASSRRRIGIAAVGCLLGALLAVEAPGISSALDDARATRQLAALAPRVHDAAAVEHELRRITGALAEVDSFAMMRRSPTTLLAAMTRALPAGAVMVTFRLDSVSGSLVLLSPRVARAIASLDSVPGLGPMEIVGPVTKEIDGTREVERASVRFRLVERAAK